MITIVNTMPTLRQIARKTVPSPIRSAATEQLRGLRQRAISRAMDMRIRRMTSHTITAEIGYADLERRALASADRISWLLGDD